MGVRRKARELALQMLFENDVTGTAPEEMFERSADLQKSAPGLREFDLLLWQDMNPVGVARAIRGVVGERAITDWSLLALVDAPAIVIAREGDAIHPAALARGMAETMPNAELIELASEEDLLDSIPMLVGRVARFLAT
jgi:pimeloyl-ACP methyl ester carboxylesterase